MNKILAWLLSSVFLDHLSLNIVFPVLTIVCFDAASSLFPANTPLAERSLWYGLVVSASHLSNIFTGPLLGAISDYCGRRFVLMWGALGALLMACASIFSLWWGMASLLVAGRVIAGLCATRAVSQAAIGDLPSKDKLTHMANLQAVIAFGAFVGPLIGGFAAQYFFSVRLNFTVPFMVSAMVALMSLWVVVYKLPETYHERKKFQTKIFLQNIKQLLCNHTILKISGLLFLSQISWSLYYQYIPPILKSEFNFSASQLGWFLSLIALWLIFASSIGMKILKKYFSDFSILRFATFMTLIGLLLTLIIFHFKNFHYLLWLSAIPVAAGDVLAYCVFTTWYSKAADANQQGLVMSICVIVVQIVWFTTGLIGGILFGLGLWLPLAVSLVGVAALLIILHTKTPLGNSNNVLP